MPRGRVFHIVTDEIHPDTGVQLITEEKIKETVEKYKSIKKWAYIKHDKDVWTEKDVASGKSKGAKAGEPKNAHFHIVLNTENNNMDVDVISKWFGIASNFIDLPKGRGAFLDCIEYLTHEDIKQQNLGKHLYPDEEIHSNFDFRAELTERNENRAKHGGQDLNLKKAIRYEVLYNGMTLLQARAADKINYMEDYKELRNLRYEYINRLDPPKQRMNFYVSGYGGVGKGLLSMALARMLAKTCNPELSSDDEMFFSIGADNASFEGYDGQPVIIWNDCRAFELLERLGGRGNVFEVFDTHPIKKRQNIKYSSINLCNVYNIVNSVDPYKKFLDGLAGEYVDKTGHQFIAEDKGQAYRRFPVLIPINYEYFTVLLNAGYFNDTPEYEELINYGSFVGNFQKLEIALENQPEKLKEQQQRLLLPVTDKVKETMEKEKKVLTDEEIEDKFGDYGSPYVPTQADIQAEINRENYRKFMEIPENRDNVIALRDYGYDIGTVVDPDEIEEEQRKKRGNNYDK